MTHFNKRHYEAIALVCQEYRDHAANFQTHAQREAFQLELETRLADMFKRDNHLFDAGRFLYACKPGRNVRSKTAHLKAS